MNKRINATNIYAYKAELEKINGNVNDIISERVTSEHDQKVNKTTKQLEELLKERESQKNKLENVPKQKKIFRNGEFVTISAESDTDLNSRKKLKDISTDGNNNYVQPRIQYYNTTKAESQVRHDPYTIPFSGIPTNLPIKEQCGYTYVWDAYWPFIGSGESDQKLDIELDYITFNGTMIEKWRTTLPTPTTSVFPIKDVFRFNLITGCDNFDFDLKLENIPSTGSPVAININPKSTTLPFNLNQFIVIKDPNITVTTPGTSPTDILAVIAYYNSNQLNLNQFTHGTDSVDSVKNIFMSTQLFSVHINQIQDDVKLTLSHNTSIGENLFKIFIETSSKVEVKETLIPVIINENIDANNDLDIVILTRTVYINGKYFMTYATYINDIASAQLLPSVSNLLSDQRQTPIQLAAMLLFDARVPLTNLDNVVGMSDHQRMILRLYREILKKNP
ncbi:putative ORFan [Tupanvirus deep ocean]|uniref:ORFan n=2 Tax=Tupanvirus TaxID=2094720 RepID=A0AC62A7A1_9VIRU|nr:putative ORFan [Tupanvirus deep ocean]QKU33670.1 putative ORFan [Tupanvirus deep ocean]